MNIKKICMFSLLLLFFVNVVYFYPGCFSTDSYYQYNQYINNNYNDWNSILMASLWVLFGIKGAVFISNLFMIYIGIILIAFFLYRMDYHRSLLFWVLFNLIPYVFILYNQVWKDVVFIGSLYLLIGLILNMEIIKYRKVIVIVILFLFFYATLSRENAVFATFPLLYFFIKNKVLINCSWKVAVVSSIFFIFLCSAFNWFITYKFFEAKKYHPSSYMMYHDLSRMECQSKGGVYIPDKYFINHMPNRQLMCSLLNVSDLYAANRLFWGKTRSSIFPTGVAYTPSQVSLPISDSDYKDLFRFWFRQVYKNSILYLSYRVKFFIHCYFKNSWGFGDYLGGKNSLFNFLIKNKINYLVIFFPVLCLYLIYGFAKRLKTKEIFWLDTALNLSGLSYLFGWLFLLPAPDARYFMIPYILIGIGFLIRNKKN